MGREPQARTRVRQERILDAALDVFSRQGYRDASVDDIALAADTSKGGIYFHFPGKQSLFVALLDRSARLLLSRVIDALEAETDPVAKLDAALLAVMRAFSSHRALARLFLVEALGAGPEFQSKMLEIHGSFADFIRRNLDRAVEQGLVAPQDTRVASLVWFGALNQIVTGWILGRESGQLIDSYPALRALLLRSIGLDPDAARRMAGS